MKLKLILKGLWIGSTMTIPGVSGGTMAVICGIYEELISAINGLAKEPKKHLPFLLYFIAGAGAGFILFARFITLLLENNLTGDYVRMLFAGIVVGGIPLLVHKSNIHRLSVSHFLYMLLGAVIVILLSQLPAGLLSSGNLLTYILLQALGGIIVAVALVLPGISVSHMLYILGIYEIVLEKVYSFRWFSLIPLVAGVIVGIFVTTNILEKLLNKHPDKIYMVITGFVAASIISLFPVKQVEHPVICIAIFLIGYVVMNNICKIEK